MGANRIGRMVPYVGSEHAPGRRTMAASSADALARRKCGATVLEVIASSPIIGKHLMNDGDGVGYAVRALGNASRETVSLARFDTLEQAQRFLEAYSPAWGLIR